MSDRVIIWLEQATPALVGHFEPTIVDRRHYLRPQSVKGLWRWFARALVAGALYDEGYLRGETYNGVRKPTKLEVAAISCLVGKVMGLGYAGSKKGESEASRFSLTVDVIRTPRVNVARSGEIDLRGRRVRLQRLQLLTLARGGRRPIEYFEGGTFRLVVTKVGSVDSEAEELGLRALLLALTLSGVGKGSRRGLGSFDIVRVEGFRVREELSQFIERSHELAIDLANRYAGDLRLTRYRIEGLPPLPVIGKSRPPGTSLPAYLLYRLSGVDWVAAHNFFVRTERCLRLFKSPVCDDDLRKSYEAWVLGLPRSQRGTGYMAVGAERRASPIILAYHKGRHLLGEGVYVSVFVSSDWPARIYWRGAGEQSLAVTEEAVIKALGNALSELWRYLRIQEPSPVWPRG